MMDSQYFFEQTARIMSDRSELTIQTEIHQAWLIISALQLATRHPTLSAPMIEQLRKIADVLTESIVERYPEAAELIDMGWNPVFDVSDEDEDEGMDQDDDDPSDYDDIPF